MVELYKLTGDKQRLDEYQRRQEITRKSLPLLLTPAGYFVKSMEPNGTKHGVLGQAQFGYLEGVANVDAVGLRVVDDPTARSIYRQIAAFPAIRPFDFLLTNAPGLDDTYWCWGHRTGGEEPGHPEVGIYGARVFGDWVNGGVWGTVEGRAILAYYRLHKFEDVRRSAARAMKWAKDFRMDAPWSQRGENTNNVWSDTGANQVGGVAVMVDNFAIPAATVRGLFDYEYRSDRIILRPCVPGSITEYVQKEPVRFGEKTLDLSCRNGGPKLKSVAINGTAMKLDSSDGVALLYDALPPEAKVEIVTEGGWEAESAARLAAARTAVRSGIGADAPSAAKRTGAAALPAELPASLRKPCAVLTSLDQRLVQEPDAAYERAFVHEALGAIDAWRQQTAIDSGRGCFRPNTPQKREAILKFYENAALCMYNGLAKRMTDYARSPQLEKQHLAEVFQRAQGKTAGPDKYELPFTANSREAALEWQTRARKRLFELVAAQTPRRSLAERPLDFKIESSEDHGAYMFHRASFQCNDGERRRCTWTAPKGPGPFPAMLCLHGHDGSAELAFDPKSIYRGFAERFARGGYCVLAPTFPHLKYAGTRVWDFMRCVDILSAQKEVDARRIGVMGLSMGGEFTMWAAACDERLKAAVVSGWMCTTEGVLSLPNCPCWELPGFVNLMNVCEVHLLIAPRPVLFESAEDDEWFPIRHTQGFLPHSRRLQGLRSRRSVRPGCICRQTCGAWRHVLSIY